MRTFVIADTHFQHEALAVDYKSRPVDFESRILQRWKEMITDADLVIHLGDVLVGKATDWASIIPQLPGCKVLVFGNHDRKAPHSYMTNGFAFCCHQFSWQMFELHVLFSHEPVVAGGFDLNIHGHLHLGQHREDYQCDHSHYLFSVERSDYQPRTLDSIVKEWKRSSRMNQKPPRSCST